VGVIIRAPFCEDVFLREVEVGVIYAGRVFHHRDGCGAEVESVVFAACLEEETLGDDFGDGEGLEEVLKKSD
jgi:hypothetical protein